MHYLNIEWIENFFLQFSQLISTSRRETYILSLGTNCLVTEIHERWERIQTLTLMFYTRIQLLGTKKRGCRLSVGIQNQSRNLMPKGSGQAREEENSIMIKAHNKMTCSPVDILCLIW